MKYSSVELMYAERAVADLIKARGEINKRLADERRIVRQQKKFKSIEEKQGQEATL